MSKPKQSVYALTYVAATRRKHPREPTWSDVAMAYDEGLRHAVEAPSPARRKIASYLCALRVLNAARAEAKA